MKITKGFAPRKLAAGALCVSAGWMLAATTALAQDGRTGVSHPPDASTITTDEGPDSSAPALAPAKKPSAAIPESSSQIVYGPYVPYHAPGTPAPAAAPATTQAFDADANIVTSETAGLSERRLLTADSDSKDSDARIVTSVPIKAGQIAEGTLLKAKLRESLSTLTTEPGSQFSAEISEPLMQEGRVIIPVGSIMEGRVTWVRGGKRIGGPAAIHIEPRRVTLPDGSVYIIRARVIDTSSWDNTKVDEEGTITKRDFGKGTAAIMGLSTGGAMAAGAVVAGPPGALIGAGIGAGVSTVLWLKQDRQAVLPKDLGLVFSLTEPMSITPINAAITKPTVSGGE